MKLLFELRLLLSFYHFIKNTLYEYTIEQLYLRIKIKCIGKTHLIIDIKKTFKVHIEECLHFKRLSCRLYIDFIYTMNIEREKD